MELLDVLKSTSFEGFLPFVTARVKQSVESPQSWGMPELIVIGLLTQIGFEFFRRVVPRAFSSWPKLPARGKPLDNFEAIDKAYVITSQLGVAVMTFHYFQLMALSPDVVFQPEQVCKRCAHACHSSSI